MQHHEFQIHILDETGARIGSKARKDIKKSKDIVHCVDIFLKRNGKILLARIPDADLLYPGTLASTSATMLRVDEEPIQAAMRALKKELGIEHAKFKELGELFLTFKDGIKRKKTSFLAITDDPINANPDDVSEIIEMSPDEINQKLETHSDMFAPTFSELWAHYKEYLA